MAFNRLPAVKQTTSINSSDSALAFLSLSHPRVCVSVWFKPSLVQSFCLPAGCISCIKGQSQCWLLQHDLLLFIISLVSISIDIFTPLVFLMKLFFSHLFFLLQVLTPCNVQIHLKVCVCVCMFSVLVTTEVLFHYRELWEQSPPSHHVKKPMCTKPRRGQRKNYMQRPQLTTLIAECHYTHSVTISF